MPCAIILFVFALLGAKPKTKGFNMSNNKTQFDKPWDNKTKFNWYKSQYEELENTIDFLEKASRIEHRSAIKTLRYRLDYIDKVLNELHDELREA
jgi:hypothetical protein